MALDRNGDGKLSYEELVDGYTKLYGSKDRAMAEVQYLMSTADVDGNKMIDYSGIFLNPLIIPMKRVLACGCKSQKAIVKI